MGAPEKKAVHQCRKCQRVGHTSSNCELDYRCVKCNVPHGPGECKIDKGETDRSKLFCVNCKTYGHPASYRGCSFLKFSTFIRENLRKKNSLRNNEKVARIDKIITSFPPRDPPKLYSRAVNPHQNDAQGSNQSPDHTINSQPINNTAHPKPSPNLRVMIYFQF